MKYICSLSDSRVDVFHGSASTPLVLRCRVDGREAPDLHRYHIEFVLERREHGPGPAGLFHPRLEAPDAGSDGALHRCHGFLVVRADVRMISNLYADRKQSVCVSRPCSGGCQSRLAGCWPMAEQRKPRSTWFGVLR